LKVLKGLAYVTADEMRLIDRDAMGEFGIDILSLMENAGVTTAMVARQMLGGSVRGKGVAVLVGKGNNGGDGLVAARHLHNWGANVRVIVGEREVMGSVPSTQLRAVEKTGTTVEGPDAKLVGDQLLIDALLGYNSKGNPREPIATIIREANRSRVPLLAVDLPSGLDATSGEPGDPCIEAKATITMSFPKAGFLNPRAKGFVGELWLGDLSLPPELYRRYSQKSDLFDEQPVARIF
jgi:NAD(P)H-hydrate epimerase